MIDVRPWETRWDRARAYIAVPVTPRIAPPAHSVWSAIVINTGLSSFGAPTRASFRSNASYLPFTAETLMFMNSTGVFPGL